ncbi:MAG: 50S ribosomal protein L24 [Candidatus Yanofskybacteria bacterium CG10_big_fil_rev_8_21_14_0_10_37_15]|uniref:Large ribosomal subunit protein uL24 n=1 Tax=Candidatus Yanofskybacteria bacterium CG10_big_fil_rev_8_21_14_0_10_37_15 TaxID=1975097 RepID=A0A2H0R5Z5_9BACT|nr:MAG: 50S ribosomal protein L24 [Candidatus Yanofskybacteria bacterium CG10_big_fil_rev_8_21_14_0_10_37_15]
MKIKKGDNIIMLGGKDKGKTGKVGKVFVENNKIIVEGLNLIKRSVRARKQGQKGQIISKERAVHSAGVALICKSCGKPTRVGYKISIDSSGKTISKRKVRICKKCKNEV